MRTSADKYIGGRLIDGFDYVHQAWVVNGIYVRCGHPASMECNCYGKRYAGYQTPPRDLTGGN